MEGEYLKRDLEIIQVILSRMLDRTQIGLDEDIYAAGITSIMTLPLLGEIEDSFSLAIPDSEFLDARTPHALAKMVRRLRRTLPA
jgi:acyl carrier protein